ncbi:aldo/keto reductase [Myxococcota bacterium]|nr:aldo/keto reductase [Myxococcota bacterium]MBU1897948.1 aldo/keto reductase [Myxococcota bacterium]
MNTLKFNNHDEMPALGLGTWRAAPGQVKAAVKAAIELGYRHIDCASIYQNEAEIGQAIAESIAEGRVTRRELWITSKLWNDAHAPEAVEPALRRSLDRLQLDHLDLYLIHWPIAHRQGVIFPRRGADFVSLDALPLAATWGAMEALVEAGLTRHIGVSNLRAEALLSLIDGARRPPEVNQVELHPYLQQPQLVATCRAAGVHLTAYSPLGSPDRPADLKAPDEPILLQDPTVMAIAEAHGASPAQVLIAWSLAQGHAVIPKSVSPARLAQNLAAATLRLTAKDMAQLGALERGRRYVTGAFWALPGSPYTLEGLWGPR